jgi:four helix bundle protein
MKGDDIAQRLLRFAVQVLKLVKTLPRDATCRHVGRQLLRAATAGGANDEEARSAESRADFVHKVSIAAKELRESGYWLKLSVEAQLTVASTAGALAKEGSELVAILTASAKTAKTRS